MESLPMRDNANRIDRRRSVVLVVIGVRSVKKGWSTWSAVSEVLVPIGAIDGVLQLPAKN